MFEILPRVRVETLIYSTYYAPRGRKRLFALGGQLSQRYLNPEDLLIGIIGAEGAGKSTLIRGLFPGLELTNDDDGANMPIAPIYSFDAEDYFSAHTFHVDIRYELAFRQKYEIVEAINNIVSHGRRVIVEHFDLIFDALHYNAQVIFGIGEEVIVSRPTVFGPYPNAIKKVVDKTIKYRLMSHTAEDITSYILERDYNYDRSMIHSDVKHGFVIRFSKKPNINLQELENKVNGYIQQNLPLSPASNNMIKIADMQIYCTGTRTHVKSTGQIINFRLEKEFRFDQINQEYLLVGMVGGKEVVGFEEINEI